MRLFLLPVLALTCLALPLAACDDQGEQTSSSSLPEATMPAAGASSDESALPEADASATVRSVEGEEGAPYDAGEAASPDDMPHSDVPPPSREVFSDAGCSFETWVGGTLAEAEQAAKETGRIVRVLEPDSMMTMDHQPDRINIVHEDGTVSRVWCG